MTELRARSASLGYFLTCSICLSILVPVLLWSGQVDFSSISLVAVVAVSGARFSWLAGLGEPRLMELSTWSFIYVFFGLAGLVQVQLGEWPETAPTVFTDYLQPATLLIVVSVVAVVMGVAASDLMPARPVSRSGDDPVSERRRIPERTAVCVALIALALNGYYLLSIGLTAPLGTRDDLRAAQLSAWEDETLSIGIVGLCTMPLLVAFIALVQINRQGRVASKAPINFLALLVFLATLYSVNPISSPRYYFGTVILSLAAALGAYGTARRLRISSLVFLVALVFLFPIADIFRRATGEVLDVGFDPLRSLTSGDFDGLIQTMNSIRYYELAKPLLGEQALAVLLFWIPRSYWPSKPDGTAIVVTEFAGYAHLNMSIPLWAEFFVNGGWVASIVGMFVFGWILRRFDNAIVSASQEGTPLSPFALILPFYLVILLRGSLLQAMVYLAVFAVVSWVVRPREGTTPAPN